ncbi:sugar ABC transporter substrate-binding protein [Oceanirhabdus sp. W0125-5]|uniref:sugar ABC transporter substrate-binding protein n=1 Tax=Oceanirhabdus sp. W0125-5 TaxID=2999116 RepID=UPI0022F321AF|nr:substrate-binding domain-containing protein [Oceanirhabdus sp. W0125-5]WBW98228.1 substrate-binding domain-containing protein [Oceanirhabdus sp. W0125-5]
MGNVGVKRLKVLFILILVGILTVLITITASKIISISKIEVEKKESKNKISRKVKVGFSMGTLKEERWLKDRDILMAKVQELGGEIIIKNANNDDDDQINQVQYLLKQGIDVLILVANDHTKASTAVKLAKEAGVKVIAYDRLVLDSNADVYLSFDNVAVGEKMAEAIVNKIAQSKIIIIHGDPSDNNTKLIRKGYYNVLQEYIDEGYIEVIGEYWAEDWMQEYAFNTTNELLGEKVKFDGVIAGNDSLAGGVIRALAEHRLAGRVYVTGQDADLDGCQRIVEGTQLMTVYKPMEEMATAGAELAMKLARGEDLGIQEKISDGTYDIPYYVIDVYAVGKYNMEETIIKDGFHLRNEVYREK